MGDVELELRPLIGRYLSGDIEARNLYDWVVRVSWECREDVPGLDLLRDVELFLEEFQHGDWSEEELKSHLRGILKIVGLEASGHRSDSDSRTEWMRASVRIGNVASPGWRSAGTRAETVSA